MMTLGNFQLTFLVPLLNFVNDLMHVFALSCEDLIELVKTCSGARNVRDLFGKWFNLLGNCVDVGFQLRHSFFQRDNDSSCLAVLFVEPLKAFDELFKL